MELYYSLNGGEWTPLIEGQNVSVSAGDKIRVKNVGAQYNSYNRFQFKKSNNENGRYNVEGSITSLVGSEDISVSIGGAFSGTGIVSAENLVLPSGNYSNMFEGCTNLTTVPELPSTILSNHCYNQMFAKCTSLTTVPSDLLPATTLPPRCYSRMFEGCTGLTNVPNLPATILTEGCYNQMFSGCTSLTTVPSDLLPATNLSGALYCYCQMFEGCTGLTTAPELPATNLTNANLCYYRMFGNCYSLETAPSSIGFDVTQMPLSACMEMFSFCTSLTESPELPAINVSTACYNRMFQNCTGLTTAPDLPATTLQRYCYGFMFSGCTNLNYIKCLATDISADNYSGTKGWVSGVASAGTFVKHPDMNDWTTGNNGIPVGWTAKEDTGVPLTFKVLSDGKIAWKARSNAAYRTIEYSKNGGEWITIQSNTYSNGNNFSVVTGDIVQFRGNLKNTGNVNGNTFSSFSATTCTFKVYGNIMSLFNSTEFATATTFNYSASTYSLFYCCTGLTDASNLLLPATTLTNRCYSYMFSGCTSLTTAPALQATTLASNCYNSMFGGCTSLTTAPALPATTLATECYRYMFLDCTSLTTAPELPATTLADSCYQQMFRGCTGLTNVPNLPATTLTSYCYNQMFSGCTSLTTVPSDLLPATTLADYCYNGMFYGCTSLTTAPALQATTLASNCYNGMFRGCTNLNYIKCLASDISASNCTTNWVNGVQTTSGRFIKNASMTGWTTGNDGIPNNWTVEDAT